MTARNAYATLSEYQDYVTARGQTATTSATDDAVIEKLLEDASRYIDAQTQRQFYPIIQNRYFDVPDTRELEVDDDLLEVLTVTNGDSATMPSTEYNLVPKNYSPAYGIKIRDVSSYQWTSNAQGSLESAIQINAIYGYHDKYSQAWRSAATTNEAVDISEIEIDTVEVTNTTGISAGSIVRIDDELMLVNIANDHKITVERGYNGSTAATHTTSTTIKLWKPMQSAHLSTLEIAHAAYYRRFGKSLSSTETLTGAGVIVQPRDIPSSAASFISVFRDRQ